ncbi:hypothetical protein SAY87_008001 [Trapa incisa]|uniref:Uncharacterized protein n=1 Tax=Trapa incisa TaxID=236973 RepID=A0AAN7KFB8_9MYRT|nr:hypothetical protein SAY87_008001 [Trapa incisa]
MDQGIWLMPEFRKSPDDEKSKRRADGPTPEWKNKKKTGFGWIEWLRGWWYVVHEFLFQRIMASHLQNPLPLPPVNELTCIVTQLHWPPNRPVLSSAAFPALALTTHLRPVYFEECVIIRTCCPLSSWLR